VPQHVGMHEEREFRSRARPGNHALIAADLMGHVTDRDECSSPRERVGFHPAMRARRVSSTPIYMHKSCDAPMPAALSSSRSSRRKHKHTASHWAWGPKTSRSHGFGGPIYDYAYRTRKNCGCGTGYGSAALEYFYRAMRTRLDAQ